MTGLQFAEWLKSHIEECPEAVSVEVAAMLANVRIGVPYVYSGNEAQRYTLQEAIELGIIERGR